jgi:hypothetical protein
MNQKMRFLLYAVLLGGVVLVNAWRQVGQIEAPKDHRVLGRVEASEGKPGEIELLSAKYRIDRMYQSMEGPLSVQEGFKMSEQRGAGETLMITGVESEVVEAESLQAVSPEFFCHSNLTLSHGATTPQAHNEGFSPPTHSDWRLFTLVPGRMSMKLPEGYGVPVRNGTRLDYLTMALNQNAGVPEQEVRIRTRIRYEECGAPMKALFRRATYVYLAHEEEPDQGVKIDPNAHAGEKCGEVCGSSQRAATPSLLAELSADSPLAKHPGATCCVQIASEGGIMPQFGSSNTIHWMVPPGRHRYTTEVTRQLDLPYDTTAHYITGHLHPTGVRMRLLEKASGRVVAEIRSRGFEGKVGVADTSEIHSKEGILLRKGSDYVMEAEYDNRTGKAIDAMAILYLYLSEEPANKEAQVAAAR